MKRETLWERSGCAPQRARAGRAAEARRERAAREAAEAALNGEDQY